MIKKQQEEKYKNLRIDREQLRDSMIREFEKRH